VAVIELASEGAEQPRPVLAPGGGRPDDLDASLDDPNSRQTGVGRSGLLLRPLPAGR
jgi:hypothetical protein